MARLGAALAPLLVGALVQMNNRIAAQLLAAGSVLASTAIEAWASVANARTSQHQPDHRHRVTYAWGSAPIPLDSSCTR
ncbi:hypothetical protein ACVWZA_000637 [Sphingomonas sp. UYAg733]